MFNNLYEKIKNFMKENGLFLLLFIIVIVFTFVKVPYEVNMAGGVIDLGNRVLINDKETDIKGTFNMAYVSVIQGSIPHVLLGLILPDWDVVPQSDSTYENETIEDANKRNKLYLEQSKDYATAVALDAAKIPYDVSNKVSYVIFIDSKANTTLQVGDDILKLNGEKVEDINILSDRIQKIDVGSKVDFLVNRDGKETTASAVVFEEDGKHYVGISALTTFDISCDTKVEISSKESESGPSGGLMMTLMVYNALTNQDLTHGMKIVGTGTISLDGSVGEIGGVKHKLMGAVKNDADVFLVPKGNYDEAMDVKEDKGYNIDIVSVSSLTDAINYLEGM